MITDQGLSIQIMDTTDSLETAQEEVNETLVIQDKSADRLERAPVSPEAKVDERPKLLQQEILATLLNKYSLLFDGTLGLIKGYTHIIEIKDNRPHKPRSFPVPLKYREEVHEQLQEMEFMGVIKKQATEFVNPLVVALRSNGKIRICLDARSINEKMANEHAQPPSIYEVLTLVGDRKFFSKIDINKTYWQV